MSLPGIETVFSKAGINIDMIVYRENIECTYGGIEHYQTNDVAQLRRLITRTGSEQVLCCKSVLFMLDSSCCI